MRLKGGNAATESLSGGQRQAVAIARAVTHADLKVLVRDEPTAALGPQETQRTLKLIERHHHLRVGGFHTMLKDPENQPTAWFDFSSAAGALVNAITCWSHADGR